MQKHWTCPRCKASLIVTVLERLRHESECQSANINGTNKSLDYNIVLQILTGKEGIWINFPTSSSSTLLISAESHNIFLIFPESVAQACVQELYSPTIQNMVYPTVSQSDVFIHLLVFELDGKPKIKQPLKQHKQWCNCKSHPKHFP